MTLFLNCRQIVDLATRYVYVYPLDSQLISPDATVGLFYS